MNLPLPGGARHGEADRLGYPIVYRSAPLVVLRLKPGRYLVIRDTDDDQEFLDRLSRATPLDARLPVVRRDVAQAALELRERARVAHCTSCTCHTLEPMPCVHDWCTFVPLDSRVIGLTIAVNLRICRRCLQTETRHA